MATRLPRARRLPAPRHNVLDLLYLKRRGLSLRLRRTKGSEPHLRRAGREAAQQVYRKDGHKATIAVSVAHAGGGEVRYFGEMATTEALHKLARQLRKGESHLYF